MNSEGAKSEPALTRESASPTQSTSGQNSPIVNQQGTNNIAQFGNNNSATIIDRERLILTNPAVIAGALKRFAGDKIGGLRFRAYLSGFQVSTISTTHSFD